MKVINRNGFEITVNDNKSTWFNKADKAGVLKEYMHDISHRVEEYGTVWTWRPKSKYTYPRILRNLK